MQGAAWGSTGGGEGGGSLGGLRGSRLRGDARGDVLSATWPPRGVLRRAHHPPDDDADELREEQQVAAAAHEADEDGRGGERERVERQHRRPHLPAGARVHDVHDVLYLSWRRRGPVRYVDRVIEDARRDREVGAHFPERRVGLDDGRRVGHFEAPEARRRLRECIVEGSRCECHERMAVVD